MKPTRQKRIRAILRENPEGLTAREISLITGMHIANVRTALRAVVDIYVDRWVKGRHGAFEKVWCAVHVPEDCPHPKDMIHRGGRGKPPKTTWRFPTNVTELKAKK